MIEKLILKVLDNPLQYRIIVGTQIPTFGEASPTLYYMIDRSPDGGETVSDKWYVSDNNGNSTILESHELLIKFITDLENACKDLDCFVELY